MNGALDIDGMLTGDLSLDTGTLSGKLSPTSDVKGNLTIPPVGPPKPTSYEELVDLPSVNEVELIGNKTFEDLGDKTLTNVEIKQIFDRVFKGGQ